MGWFKKTEEKKSTEVSSYDPRNPFSSTIVDEGEFVTIVHESQEIIENLDEEEVNDGSANNSDSISE